MKKVLFPIYLKLVFFILIIIGVSLSSYVYYAVDLFKNDKISYVYEAVNDNNEQYFFRTKIQTEQITKNLNQISMINFDSDFIMNLLKEDSNLIAYFEIINNKLDRAISFYDKNQYDEIYHIEESRLGKNKFLFKNNKVIFFKQIKNKTFGFILKHKILFLREKNSLYQNDYIINGSSDDTELQTILDTLNKENRFGQSFMAILDERYIVSSRKISENLILISRTKYDKAISASSQLRTNSFYFGLLIAGLVIIIILFFSTFFTRPINILARVVNEFLSTDFKTRADIKSSDEIGFLASSFNKMADEINIYMGEMEEKTRLEEELKTANIVQSQFFPKKTYNDGPYTIHGHYQSATECGGDWWGVYESAKASVIIVADVTGHGTPAALMTAVLHSSLNSLEYLSRNEENFITKSDKVMEFLNTSFSKSTNKLNSTAFVLCIDHENKQINYTNASHNPPFFFANHKGELKKSDILPLLEKIGPRLGEGVGQKYESTNMTVKAKDKIIFYTDGLLEGENFDKQVYGQRKFLKVLLDQQNSPIDGIINSAVADFYQFIGSEPLKDDMTLVGLEIH